MPVSSIDLVILGMVLEKPQSAYELQKDIEYHNFSRWTKISVPSVYKKVLQLKEKGYLASDVVKGERYAEKAIYSVTDAGKAYFETLMDTIAGQDVPLTFDFNVVVTNLNKLDRPHALALVEKLRSSILASMVNNEAYAQRYADIPLVGRTIFDQQRLLYQALLEWLDAFSAQFTEEGIASDGEEQPYGIL